MSNLPDHIKTLLDKTRRNMAIHLAKKRAIMDDIEKNSKEHDENIDKVNKYIKQRSQHIEKQMRDGVEPDDKFNEDLTTYSKMLLERKTLQQNRESNRENIVKLQLHDH